MILCQVPVGSDFQDLTSIVALRMDAEYQDSKFRLSILQQLDHLERAWPRHRYIEQQHVDVHCVAPRDRGVSIRGFADNLDIAILRDDVLETLSENLVIVGNHQAD